jgi:hypothetical protein
VLSGENFSAIIVKSKDDSASWRQIAVETPIIPAPIIATFFLRNCDILFSTAECTYVDSSSPA